MIVPVDLALLHVRFVEVFIVVIVEGEPRHLVEADDVALRNKARPRRLGVTTKLGTGNRSPGEEVSKG